VPFGTGYFCRYAKQKVKLMGQEECEIETCIQEKIKEYAD
jgi:hypothetical protein